MASIIRKIINTVNAPKPVAPYNQAILVDRMLYLSGVLGLDKDTNRLVTGGTVAETRLALETLGHILKAGGSSYNDVVKVTILLKDIGDFKKVNDVYIEFFKKDFPARCAYQVAALPLDANIEIECIAVANNLKDQAPSGKKWSA